MIQPGLILLRQGLADDDVPQPSALAEFFGDHMVVNGMIWPKTNVERRNYRLRLLNGCDSRFMVLQFRQVALGAEDLSGAGAPIPFDVDRQRSGPRARARRVDKLVMGPGERYDVVINFRRVPQGSRVIMSNEGLDAPFGGDFGRAAFPDDLYPDSQTDRIMAFDVVLLRDNDVPDTYDRTAIGQQPPPKYADKPVDVVRKVALFEGKDEYGRLQPLLGIVNGIEGLMISEVRRRRSRGPTRQPSSRDSVTPRDGIFTTLPGTRTPSTCIW